MAEESELNMPETDERFSELLRLTATLLDAGQESLKMCLDCGKTFRDELAHACLGRWNGSFGNFIPDTRDRMRKAKGYAVQ